MSDNFTGMHSLSHFPIVWTGCYVAGPSLMEAQDKHEVMPHSSCSCPAGVDRNIPHRSLVITWCWWTQVFWMKVLLKSSRTSSLQTRSGWVSTLPWASLRAVVDVRCFQGTAPAQLRPLRHHDLPLQGHPGKNLSSYLALSDRSLLTTSCSFRTSNIRSLVTFRTLGCILESPCSHVSNSSSAPINGWTF